MALGSLDGLVLTVGGFGFFASCLSFGAMGVGAGVGVEGHTET